MLDLFLLTNGISIGIVLFLAAAGLTILFGILKILNFAHGSFIMVGAYLTSSVLKLMPGYGVAEFLLTAVGVGIVVGLLGLVVDRIVFRRLHGIGEAVALIATFALMLVIDGGVALIWGVKYVSVDAPQGMEGAVFLGSLVLPSFSVLLVGIGLATFLAIDLLLTRSWVGKTLQSISEDRWIMDILGFNPRRLEFVAVFAAFFLAGFAGSVLSPNQVITPSLGGHMIIQAFAVVVVGGLGSVRGAFLAAMLLGLAESFGSGIMPSLSLYIGMIIILVLRPQGLIAPKLSAKPGSWSISWLWEGLYGSPKRAVPAMSQEMVPATARKPVLSAAELRVLILLGIVLLSVPLWAGSGVVFAASLVLISTIFSMSWNLMFGYGGMASFGHGAFFAIGAYLSAYMLKTDPGASFALILLSAMVLGALIAAPVGIIALRRSTGVQLAILTLALAEILRVLISYSIRLGRDEGLTALPRPTIGFGEMSVSLGPDTSYYLFLCLACGAMVAILWAVSHSSFGRVLRSIRQDAPRATFLGVNVDRFRLQGFMLAAAVAAYAGALAAPLSQIVTPQAAAISRSTEPMLHTLLGGAGSFWGPAVGTIIFAAVNYATRTMAGLSELVMGLTLLAVVLIAPGGAAGFLRDIGGGMFRRRSPTPPAKAAAEGLQ
ncbi:branched-chain amino acid transport system permease protein [Rhizobiales bacterium GAS191]|nr:branched-chain amino acid transport system permease protein [Rhizobiales bacterium GAS113]SEF15501.1 branched-chain amino acid transport system permease protein [Rhizobiales bacterium GAS191]